MELKAKTSLISATILVLSALIYYVSSYNSISQIDSKEVVKIAVSQTPLSSPFIVADQLGLFKKSDVQVELIPCKGGVACARSLFNDEVGYATSSESVVMFESFKQDDISLVSCFVESGNNIKLLALQESGIKSLEQLNGKKIGIVKASASEFYFDSMLIANNLKTLPVERVYIAPDKLNQALVSGDVDAISVWEPYGFLLTSSVENVVDLSLEGIYHLTFNLITRKSSDTVHLENTIAILTALEESIQWMKANPSRAQEIVAESLSLPQSQLDWSWHDYAFRLSIGNALLSNLQLQARWALDSNLVEGSVPNYRNILDSQALEYVQRNPLSVK
ncbi:ABC transporter substrate-binding protein [uncultured Vibrio sp.]|uniref:ABC transporter substrate-binding protein n=1 Tax=uncultured Vibrio sp. TaxID=114054 RepID=UPI0025E6D255|nr:ABC transporter substrate-binding protein [uncultured Vibrio sp.]